MKRAPSDVLEVDGVRKQIREWAAERGCAPQTIIGRLNRGWDAKRAVTEPVGDTGGQNRGKTLPPEVLTPDELKAILAECNDGATGQRNRAMIVAGWRAGLRISEALALEPKDLDEKERTIRILHGKGDKSGTIGLDAQAFDVIKTWLEVRASLGVGPHAPLFCTLAGNPLNDRYVRALMPRLAAAAGVMKRTHYHALRHTMAFELASEGVPVHVIQRQLRHSSLKVTSEYLNHLNPTEAIAAMKDRSWDGKPVQSAALAMSTVPPPGWVSQLKADVGDRLVYMLDSRQSETDFRVVVLMF